MGERLIAISLRSSGDTSRKERKLDPRILTHLKAIKAEGGHKEFERTDHPFAKGLLFFPMQGEDKTRPSSNKTLILYGLNCADAGCGCKLLIQPFCGEFTRTTICGGIGTPLERKD